MLDKQLAFNRAVAGLRQQQTRSANESGFCMYRGPNNTKCAVGWLIPDDEYNPEFDNGSGTNLYKVRQHLDPDLGVPDDDDTNFLRSMQRCIHDQLQHDWNNEDFEARVAAFATDYNLEIPA